LVPHVRPPRLHLAAAAYAPGRASAPASCSTNDRATCPAPPAWLSGGQADGARGVLLAGTRHGDSSTRRCSDPPVPCFARGPPEVSTLRLRVVAIDEGSGERSASCCQSEVFDFEADARRPVAAASARCALRRRRVRQRPALAGTLISGRPA
jgi:hypothetical protein